MNVFPFSSYLNHYAGESCAVVGRGCTDYDYQKLSKDGFSVVFFINDAVALEAHLEDQPSFYFCHDRIAARWLTRDIRSIAVLPRNGKVISGETDPVLAKFHGSVIFYEWRRMKRGDLLKLTREELANVRQLYTHSGTIHSLLHFVWFCGIRRVTFIGCDGLTRGKVPCASDDPVTGHDPRIENYTQTNPAANYDRIKREQDRLCRLLRLQTQYVGARI